MSFFKKKYSVCLECRLHFEPYPDYDSSDFKHYCPIHRQPRIKERQDMIDFLEWCKLHRVRLEKMRSKEAKKTKKQYQATAVDLSALNQQSAAWYNVYKGQRPYDLSGLIRL